MPDPVPNRVGARARGHCPTPCFALGRGSLSHRLHPYALATLLALLAVTTHAHAQTTWEVYLDHGETADAVVFVNPLSGAQRAATVTGERYTVLPDGLLFYDIENAAARLMRPDGSVEDHPFITPGGYRVDWAVGAGKIAWTRVDGPPEALTTVTRVANLDGTDVVNVFADGPRNGIRALPVAFDADGTVLYMDFQPDGLGDVTPFTEYAGLFQVSLKDGDGGIETLPGEPGCYCGAGLGSGLFLRLALAENLRGFDLNIVNLVNGARRRIPALRLANYTQGGSLLIAPDGSAAVYGLARVENFGTAEQTVETIFVFVDLLAVEQRALTDPQPTTLRPLLWTEANSAVVLTSDTENGTWKLDVATGEIERIASLTYLGRIG